MAVMIQTAPVIGPGRYNPKMRATRKIALFGSQSSALADAPWQDDSWELWGHATCRAWYRTPMDRYFDLHSPIRWTRGGKKGAKYPDWLAKNTTPIYMQKKYPEVPASVEYPKDRILQEFSYCRPYFTNHIAWMIALALTEGVSTIGLFGISYQTADEWVTQRGCCEYWLGIAQALGVRVVLPKQSCLLAAPKLLYGYESHDEVTGLLRPEYANKFKELSDRKIAPTNLSVPPAVPTPELKREIDQEETDNPRPVWALGPINGNGHKEGVI